MAKVPAASKPSTAPHSDDQWRIPDLLWQRIEPLLPARPPHPLGGHNPSPNISYGSRVVNCAMA